MEATLICPNLFGRPAAAGRIAGYGTGKTWPTAQSPWANKQGLLDQTDALDVMNAD